MNPQKVKYFTRQVNAGEGECIYGREQIGNDREFVSVRDKETGLPILEGVQKIRRYKAKISGAIEELKEIADVEVVKEKKRGRPKKKPIENPHGTGSKRAYTKIFTNELLKIPRKKLSFELIGICLCLTKNVEWETGFLVCGRGKNKRFMTQRDIAKALKVSLGTVNGIIGKLKELNILVYDNVKYSLSTKFFAKGRVYGAD